MRPCALVRSGHELPQNEPITVHFTFQFGDTGEYPHGKRQRAREAALWAVDPPSYFTEGIFVAIVGPTTTEAYQEKVYARFPEWSPQRHMFMDAPQRQAVRAVLKSYTTHPSHHPCLTLTSLAIYGNRCATCSASRWPSTA